ncbi:hypothetical protein L873DRAFT_1822097, partial [Choiromyces venosus 120613-1]
NFVLATSVSTTPIPHRNSYSTTPSRQTRSFPPPTAPGPLNQLRFDPTAMEAV